VYSFNEFVDLTGRGLHNPMTVSGVEMATQLFNERTLRSYDISFVVPIPEKIVDTAIRTRPFLINLRMRADGDVATFDASASELYFEGQVAPIKVDKALLVQRAYWGYYDIPAGAVEPVRGKIAIFNKQTVMTASGKEITDMSIPHKTYLQLRFDVETPDPSEKFHLKLGTVITPSGESVRPTIYFTPINYVEIMH